MTLRIAVQMDPMDKIAIGGDSTFALMLGAQARGHQLFHYAPEDLNYRDGRLWAEARPVRVQRVEGDHYRFGDPVQLDLGTDADVVLMRQDPPFDLGYITATHLLERVRSETLIVNDPASVRNAPEKVWVLDFARFMPPTLLTRSLAEARAFVAEQGEVVVKPLHGNGGKAVFKVGRDAANLSSLIEVFNAAYREPHIVQAFLPEVAAGDKRIVFIDGEVTGAVNRLPGEGEIRSNLAVGGKAAKAELTADEREICAAIGPELRARGLFFVGIDVIGGKVLEINAESPGGMQAVERLYEIDVCHTVIEALERRTDSTS